MSKFPKYLEEWLNVVELNIHLDRSPDKAQTLVNRLRERIERYAHERVSINAAKLARLEKAVQSVIDQGCEDRCQSQFSTPGPCTCNIGRLKAALEP